METAIIVVDGGGSFSAGGHRLLPGRHQTDDPELVRAVVRSGLDWVRVENPVVAEALEASGPVALQDPEQARASVTTHLEGPANELEPGPLRARDFKPEFPCPDCDRTFQNTAGLASHRRAKHGGVARAPGSVEPKVDSGPPVMEEQTPPRRPTPFHAAPE